jgi:hypothetical protein
LAARGACSLTFFNGLKAASLRFDGVLTLINEAINHIDTCNRIGLGMQAHKKNTNRGKQAGRYNGHGFHGRPKD